ncbi:MAG: GGDEF domain-containing protein [Clostridiales Family XIII bacterium]|nr:GGDEF domain-containing protein [Clostridiales Family XIII bacterium]
MDKKLYLLIVISLVLFLVVSILSFVSIKQLQGNARVVNYDGIVRGATQKLMKMELQNAYSGNVDVEARDALRSRLDSILGALDTGKGTTEETASIIKLDDATHSEMIDTLIVQWADLKSEIDNVRDGEKPDTLYALSEDYFKLANDTVFAAEAYSEKQVDKTQKILIGVDSIFILVIVIAGIFIARSMAVRKRADALGKIAYVDPLTGLENRASCERMIEKLKEGSSSESLAVLMFDMNNLKLANDFLGHQGGDKIILQFAKIIDKESKDFGFIGRYGGDEFLGIFENSDELRAREYLSQVNEQINAYNSLQVNDIEKVSFAVGVATGSLDATSIDDLIYEADRNMYTNKREMKKAM